MKSENSTTFDLFEDKLFDFEDLVKADVQAFIKEDLRIFYRAWRDRNVSTEKLAQELLLLVQSQYYPTPDSWVFVDEWSINLFGRIDVSTSNKCRNLLYYLFTDFENSVMLKWICKRFELSKSKLLQTVKPSRIFIWLKLWLVHHYPNIAIFLFGKKSMKPFISINDIELKKVIFYLPKFMFWNIHSCLKTSRERFLVRELAAGKSIRHVQENLVPLTKKMAHYFMNAPQEFNLNSAVWFGIVVGLNGNHLLFKAFRTHFDYQAKNLDFLKSLITFFVNAKSSVNARELSQFLNYLQHLWDEQGAYSIKGWTLKSLRRRVEQWEEERDRRIQLGNVGIKLTQTWPGATYSPYEVKTEEAVYQIIQLNSVEELFKEGRDMRHCVATYAQKCIHHMTSIWSLREVKRDKFKRLVTIEVNKKLKIVQVRRKSNAIAKKNHRAIIQKWAIKEGLKF